MKKTTAIILTTILLMINTMYVTAAELPAPTYTQEDAVKWTMGFSKKTNSMIRGKQGSNGWYCLYTPETNRNGGFNLSLIQPTEWKKTANAWKYYGVTYNWSPSLSGYDSSDNGNWWLMDGNGRMDPNVSEGVVSGVYAWAAPRDADYEISVSYTAGGSNQEYDGVREFAEDGVTISINTKKGMFKKAEAPATSPDNLELSQGNLSGGLALKKGDFVYFIVDPQESGNYDYAQLQISITTTEAEPEAPEDGAGDGEGDGAGDGEGDNSGNGDGTGSGDGSETGVGDGDGSEDGTGSGNGNGDGTGTGSGNGNGNGNGNGSGEGDSESEKGNDSKPTDKGTTDNKKDKTDKKEEETSKTPQGMPNVPLPQQDIPEEEPIDNEEIKEEKLKALSDEVADKLTEALEDPQSEEDETAEEEEGEDSEAAGGGSEGGSKSGLQFSETMILVIALVEVLAGGVIVGVGRFYMNV